jgi:hypothetical protein
VSHLLPACTCTANEGRLPSKKALTFLSFLLLSFHSVRIYQDPDYLNIGCDTELVPTAQYISDHAEAYSAFSSLFPLRLFLPPADSQLSRTRSKPQLHHLGRLRRHSTQEPPHRYLLVDASPRAFLPSPSRRTQRNYTPSQLPYPTSLLSLATASYTTLTPFSSHRCFRRRRRRFFLFSFSLFFLSCRRRRR